MAITLGTIIRARRKEIGMTQEELAHKLGYKSKVSINKIELGLQKLPSDKIGAVARDTKGSQSRRMIAYWLQTAPDEQINAVAALIEAINRENK